MPDYKNPVCRGSFALGTACRKCERCQQEPRTAQEVAFNVPGEPQIDGAFIALDYTERMMAEHKNTGYADDYTAAFRFMEVYGGLVRRGLNALVREQTGGAK